MAVNKIKISTSTRKILNKTKRTLGMKGENLQEVLLFDLDKKIEGNAIVEIELPDGAQSFVELTETEEGYELPVKSVLTEQVGFVKFQLRILQNKVEVFKSEIFELEVKESLNAIYEEPEEYPTWLDKLEDLQTELNNSEKERISNENERIESEEARKENFTQMQESVKGAISNIKDLTEKYNLNATEKTNKFDENYSETLKCFNDNAETKYDNYNKNAENKTSEYNKNNDEKLKAYNDNYTTKITNFDTNAKNKTDEYNSNASKKLDDYNSNDTTKTEKYNENATTKLNDYNSNATTKKEEYDTNTESKIAEFNNNATEKLDEYNQNAESLTNRIIECESENERLREDIKSIAIQGEAIGENIHIEDSSSARCELEICGNHSQDTREGYNQFKITSTSTKGAGITITKVDGSSVSYQGTTTGLFTHILVEYDGNGLEITKQMYLKAFGNLTNAILSVKLIKNGKIESSYLRVSPDLILSAGDVLQQIYVQQQNTGILVSGTLQVLLTDYENKDKPYEQYGASPSIPYPSSVKAVGDIKNILDMSNAKGGTSGGITCAVNEDGSYSYVGTASSKTINIWLLGSYSNKTSIFRLEPGTYYIDGVRLYDANNPLANPGTTKIFSFINAHDITGVRAPDAVPGNTYDETKYPIIAEIDHKIPWVPYNYGSVQVNIQNKNYLGDIVKGSVTENGIIATYDGEKFLCKGTTTSGFFGVSKRTNIYLPIGTYTFSQNAISFGRFVLRLYYRDNTFSTHYISTATWRVSFTTSKEAVSFGIFCDSLSSGINIDYTVYVQLKSGKTNTDWIKPEIQQRISPVQQTMFEGDTFVKQDAKWCEKHNWKTMSFDGQNMASQAGGTFADFKENGNVVRVFKVSDLLISSVRDDILCDKLPVRKDSMWNGKDYGIQTYQNQNNIVISLPYADVEKNYGEELTVDNYTKAYYKYLQDNELTIYYKLAEPVLLECTEAQSKVLDEIYSKAHTYKNITNISAESAEINPIVNVKYLKDTETEHNKLQAQINEIKELLSSTETSALLVNNLEKDLRMEVE